MKSLKNTLYTFLFALCFSGWAQQTPGLKQTEPILITGATAHIGNGTVIQNSAIGFQNGKLTYVGNAGQVNKAEYKKIIDAAGKHVYPGFIAANTSLGLVEIDAVRATDDDAEIGTIIPHIRSLIAYNAESKVIESMRPNGVLLAQVAPRGGRISGTSSIMQLDAWNWEDAVSKADDGIHLNWPSFFSRSRGEADEEVRLKPNENYTKQVDELVSFFAQAKVYLKGARTPQHIPYEAVKGLFDGTQRIYINARGAHEIVDAVNTVREAGIATIVIIGGDEAHKIIDFLKTYKIPVLISRPHRLPDSEDDNVKHPFRLAKLLTDGGLLVSIDVTGGMERMNTRNLPFYAGTCAAYGLEKEKAVQLITGNAAKILGIDSYTGTLEVGKEATLFVSEGDALDMRTNQLSQAYIQGRELSLETHQTALWKRYMEKYKHSR